MSQDITLFVPQDAVPKLLHALQEKHEFRVSAAPSDNERIALFWRGFDIPPKHYLGIRHLADGSAWIEELEGWHDQSPATRNLLKGKEVLRFIYKYNDYDKARAVVWTIIETLGTQVDQCVMENDLGVLLRLGDVAEYWRKHPDWDWRKDHFPELPDQPKVWE